MDMEIGFNQFNRVENNQLKYAVICAAYRGKWIFVRHKERLTWEVPGGHREMDEEIDSTASRELYEETGAIKFKLEQVALYSVTKNETITYGALYYADIAELGPLPESEICQVQCLKKLPEHLTYPDIQPHLFNKVKAFLNERMLKLLCRDRIRNSSILQFMRSYDCYSFDQTGESVLVRGTSDEDWVYISSESEEEFSRLLNGLDEEDKCFAVLEDWMLPAIVENKEIRSRLTSLKLVFGEDSRILAEDPEVVELSISDAPYVYQNSKYQEYVTVEYIEERIKSGMSAGLHRDGMLVAWAITHDDGAIGFLHVLDEYRGKGFATKVCSSIISRLQAINELPFVHIEEANTASLKLAKKVGFKQDRRIHWIKLK